MRRWSGQIWVSTALQCRGMDLRLYLSSHSPLVHADYLCRRAQSRRQGKLREGNVWPHAIRRAHGPGERSCSRLGLLSITTDPRDSPDTPQGHVDATATITSKIPDGDSIRYTFTLSPPLPSTASTSSISRARTLMPYLVEKGYITIDGASLTLTEVDDESASFGIMLIAYSQTKLVLASKEVGDRVNIEADCVGKYVLGSQARIEGMVERILERKLKERGM